MGRPLTNAQPLKLLVTAERVREVLNYDAETGIFTRRVATKYGGFRAGEVAGYLNDQGYLVIKIDGREYRAHRLAWFVSKGVWPKAQIDHINGVRNDNRIGNLREATHAENGQNRHRAMSNNNSTGELGVTWDKAFGKYVARIGINGKRKCLGHFRTIEAAVAARAAAEVELFPFSTRNGKVSQTNKNMEGEGE